MHFENILFCGDFTRPSLHQTSDQASNVAWLEGLFWAVPRALGGATLSLEDDVLNERVVDFWRRTYAPAHGVDMLHRAAEFYDGDGYFLDPIFGKLQNALVIGFELSPAIICSLERCGVSYIDIRVHPVRCLTDLILAARSNLSELHLRLIRNELDLPGRDACLSALMAYHRRRAAFNFETDRPTVFIAQSRFDTTVIKDGRFLRFDDIAAAIADIPVGQGKYVIPHPHDPDNPIVEDLRNHLGFQIVRESMYKILSVAPAGAQFVTINSSAGYEAQLAGFDVLFIGSVIFGSGASDGKMYIAQTPAILLEEFWKDGAHRKNHSLKIPSSPNMLRKSLGEAWGFPF